MILHDNIRLSSDRLSIFLTAGNFEFAVIIYKTKITAVCKFRFPILHILFFFIKKLKLSYQRFSMNRI